MKILVINSGSSSLKYQLLDMSDNSIVAKGLVERIGIQGSVLTHSPASGKKEVINTDIPNHDVAIQLVLDTLVNKEYGVLSDLSEITAVGHRVVHGGEKISDSALVTAEVKKAIEECIELSPLHNPANYAGILACEKLMPGLPQVAVFDTAFHQTMPPKAYSYGVPYEYYTKYKIRKYGFHGTSHKYVSQRAAKFLKREGDENLKLIVCHLGNGSSISAIKGGQCVETSMGLTPLQGLIMGTRSGDIDPAVVSYLCNKEKMTADEVVNILNKKSGVLGVSGVSSDFRDLEEAAEKGNTRAQLALDMFVYTVKKFIGSYAAVLNGVDAIVFTAGIGENSASMRSSICEGLDYLGAKVDQEKNKVRGEEIDVSTLDATCHVLVIPTNEELMIALDTLKIAGK